MSYKYDCLSHCVGEHTDSCVAYNDKREAYQRVPYRWSEKGTPMNSSQNTGTNVQQYSQSADVTTSTQSQPPRSVSLAQYTAK